MAFLGVLCCLLKFCETEAEGPEEKNHADSIVSHEAGSIAVKHF